MIKNKVFLLVLVVSLMLICIPIVYGGWFSDFIDDLFGGGGGGGTTPPASSCDSSECEADASANACACISGSAWDANKNCCGDDVATSGLSVIIPYASDDPDLTEKFCKDCSLGSNAGKRGWGEKGCCGDDSGDCNIASESSSGSYLCWNSPIDSTWSWMNASDYKGKILDSGCGSGSANEPALSNGTDWLFCTAGSKFEKRTGNAVILGPQGSKDVSACEEAKNPPGDVCSPPCGPDEWCECFTDYDQTSCKCQPII